MAKEIECFKIKILKASANNIFDIESMKSLFDIICDKNPFCINPNVIYADPFLLVYNGMLFLFYEAKKLGKPGVIMMTCTADLSDWKTPVTVLQENFHLSFPFVFVDAGNVYMIPETGEDHSVRLYKADQFDLTGFSFVTKLLLRETMDNIPIIDFCDSFLFIKDNIYYLFTTTNCEGENILELYYSDSLIGKYRKHPSSPIVKSNKTGRSAGSAMRFGDQVFRFAQDCVGGYGDNVNILEIEELDKERYVEHLFLENIFPLAGFYKRGGHQYNSVIFEGSYVVATDAKEYHSFYLARIVRRLKMRFLRGSDNGHKI